MANAQALLEEKEALDPSTSPARLAVLVEDHLEAVLKNPALPLLLLERPDFWGELRSDVQEWLASVQPCPPSFVEWMRSTTHEDAPRAELMRNPSVPVADRRAIFMALPIDTDWSRVFGVLPSLLSPDELALSRRAWGDRPLHTLLTEVEIPQLLTLGGMGLYLALQEPACPVALLESNYRDNPKARLLLAEHARLPAWCLAEAAASPDAEVRAAAASNPALPPELQLTLATDADAGVREALRDNESVTPEAVDLFDETDAKP